MKTHDRGQAKDGGRRNSTFALVRGLSTRGTHTPNIGPLLDVLLRLEAAFFKQVRQAATPQHRRDADEVKATIPGESRICEALPGAGSETGPGARHLFVTIALVLLSVSAVSSKGL